MKLEAGRYYKTRDGRKAYVAAVGNPLDASTPCPAIGWVGNSVYVTWSLQGREYSRDESPYDLVAEWVEPVSQTFDVVLLRYPDGVARRVFREVGEYWTHEVVLDRQTVTLTEGSKR